MSSRTCVVGRSLSCLNGPIRRCRTLCHNSSFGFCSRSQKYCVTSKIFLERVRSCRVRVWNMIGSERYLQARETSRNVSSSSFSSYSMVSKPSTGTASCYRPGQVSAERLRAASQRRLIFPSFGVAENREKNVDSLRGRPTAFYERY
jgi:hypothetical protein